MPLPKLMLVPNEDGYSATADSSVRRAKVSAGPSRTRLDMVGAAPFTASVRWNATREQSAYIEAFFRTVVKEGSEPFLIDLILDPDPDVREYEAKLIPNTKRLGAVRGLSRTIEMQLEVKPPAADADSDNALVLVYEGYLEESGDVLALLAALVNEDMPLLQ